MTEKYITNTPRAGETPEQTAARYNRGRDPLLQERQKTHGSFELNAQISQEIKAIYHKYDWTKLPPVMREALEMDALKTSRILSGQHMFKDHWDDKAGYAKLASEACDDSR